MFEIKNVSKKYNEEYAVKDLNLEIGSGLNFIIGASGSGKTTLLKIISGMDNKYEGDTLYFGQSIKKLTDEQRAYYYNNTFGFIGQDFNLIEDMIVEDNIMLPIHLKDIRVRGEVEKILKKLRIASLRNKKVKLLSGGQKQRVAIARELLKNPEVLIADEPTSALDSKTSIEVIQILKEISKDRTVIVVTHDTSLIDTKSKVYELDKGELISKPKNIDSKSDINKSKQKAAFNLLKAIKVGKINSKSKISRTIVSCLAIIVSSVLLMTSLGGSISNSGDKTFEQLFKEYGNAILDISIIKSFTSAEGTEGTQEDGPKGEVNQNIDGLYDKYINDERVEHCVFIKAFNDININVEGKKYAINGSGQVPIINEIIEGNAPKNKGEVLVPESFVKSMGISNQEAIGKEIDFQGSIYNWDSGQPEPKDINIKAKISGVADTTLIVNFEGITNEFDIEDSFFFDKDTLIEVNKQANVKSSNHDFTLRVKEPKSLIEIKDEINATGIVPLGQFELVEDIVKLDSQTKSLSKGSTMVISALAIVALVAISSFTSVIRRREYAIYKVCGYSKSQLSLVTLSESLILFILSAISLVVLSPAINMLTIMAFETSITNINTLALGVLISLVLSMITYIVSSEIAKRANPLLVLKSGATK